MKMRKALQIPILNKNSEKYFVIEELCKSRSYTVMWSQLEENVFIIIFGWSNRRKEVTLNAEELKNISPSLLSLLNHAFDYYRQDNKPDGTTAEVLDARRDSMINATISCWCNIENTLDKEVTEDAIFWRWIDRVEDINENKKRVKVELIKYCLVKTNTQFGPITIGDIEKNIQAYTFKQLDKRIPGFTKRVLIAKALGLDGEEQDLHGMATSVGNKEIETSVGDINFEC